MVRPRMQPTKQPTNEPPKQALIHCTPATKPMINKETDEQTSKHTKNLTKPSNKQSQCAHRHTNTQNSARAIEQVASTRNKLTGQTLNRTTKSLSTANAPVVSEFFAQTVLTKFQDRGRTLLLLVSLEFGHAGDPHELRDNSPDSSSQLFSVYISSVPLDPAWHASDA